ncbi:hypothetical protein AJ78_04270 [Emergomyces pasteurianus Ep9510]|uniref:Chromo domain-containing protein n=1 Tax=Emergomyces pasteurianus Ep9510 TaxID=1447872 RepID=A0A1J9PHT0_9EURO|nr:hypothetical protein AJ78_04270 [Emergomyces pasteurianus Ep9510]
MDIDGEDGWEVEKILTVRKIYNRLEYWVKWVGYDEDLVWYPAPNFIGSPHLVRHFHDENPTKPGPPLRLPEWLRAWEADDEDLQNTQMMTRWPRGRPSPWEVRRVGSEAPWLRPPRERRRENLESGTERVSAFMDEDGTCSAAKDTERTGAGEDTMSMTGPGAGENMMVEAGGRF